MFMREEDRSLFEVRKIKMRELWDNEVDEEWNFYEIEI